MAAAFANAASSADGLASCYSCTGDTGADADADADADIICTALSDTYACEGYRLPTEAEWEAAARCGEDTLYAGSSVLGDVLWCESNSGDKSHTVATKAANACGLYDMSGNVSEWIQDWYSESYYSSSPDADPLSILSADRQVVRGGSWNSLVDRARVSNRLRGYPDETYPSLGFRLARTSP